MERKRGHSEVAKVGALSGIPPEVEIKRPSHLGRGTGMSRQILSHCLSCHLTSPCPVVLVIFFCSTSFPKLILCSLLRRLTCVIAVGSLVLWFLTGISSGRRPKGEGRGLFQAAQLLVLGSTSVVWV